MPVLGDAADIAAKGCARRPLADGHAFDFDPALLRRFPPLDDCRQGRLTVARDACKAGYFPGAQIEADILQGGAARSVKRGYVLQAKHRGPGTAGGELGFLHLVADHERRQFGTVGAGALQSAGKPAAAQHQNAVADGKHLVELV